MKKNVKYNCFLLTTLLHSILFAAEQNQVTYWTSKKTQVTFSVPTATQNSRAEIVSFIKSVKEKLPYNPAQSKLPLACFQADCQHKKTHQNGFKSIMAIQVHVSQKSNSNGTKKSHPFRCPYCNKVNTSYITGIWTHYVQTHWEQETIKEPIKCKNRVCLHKKRIKEPKQKERPVSMAQNSSSSTLTLPQNLLTGLAQISPSLPVYHQAISEYVHGHSVPQPLELPPAQQ
jgi:hypothetical protein